MRNYQLTVRAFLGAAALSTLVAACEDAEPPKKIAVVSTPAPAPTKPEVRVEPPAAPPPAVATTETPKSDAGKSDAGKGDTARGDDGSVDQLVADARTALDKGELGRALKLARRAAKKAPTRSAAFNTLGRVQLRRGERKDAIASFQKSVELNPSSSYAENNLGLALIYDGKYEEAVDALEDATQLSPVEPYMWNNLGMAYEHLDRLDDARDAYKQAVAAAADDSGAAVAKENLVRLAGVKSIKPMRTAKIDSVESDVQPSSTPAPAVPTDQVGRDAGTHSGFKNLDPGCRLSLVWQGVAAVVGLRHRRRHAVGPLPPSGTAQSPPRGARFHRSASRRASRDAPRSTPSRSAPPRRQVSTR